MRWRVTRLATAVTLGSLIALAGCSSKQVAPEDHKTQAEPRGAAAPVDDYGDPLPPGAMARLGTVRLRHGYGSACLAFSPNGKTLVSGGHGQTAGLRVWDVATGKDLGWFPTADPATAAQFTRNGKILLTTDNSGSIRLWQAGTGKLLRETKQPPDHRLFHGLESFLSANGKVAGVIGLGGDVRLWETATGKRILARKAGGQTQFFSAALSPDGQMLVVSGEASEGNCAHLLEVTTGKEVRQIEGPNRPPHLQPGSLRRQLESFYCFAFSPDGRLLAGATRRQDWCLWEVATGRLRYTVKTGGGPLAFSPDGKHLVCGGWPAIRLYEAETGKEVRRFERHPGFVNALAFAPDGKTLASAEQYTVSLWDVATGRRRHHFLGHECPVDCLAYSPDGTSLASGDGGDGTLIVWDLQSRRPRHTFRGHAGVLSVAWSPDGTLLATGDGLRSGGTGGFDAQIRLWSLAEGQLVRRFPGHINSVQSLAFAPDGRTLASAGHDARARLWDVATGKRLLQIRGADSSEKTVAFSPDGKALLVAGTSGELALWQVPGGQKLRDLGPPRDEGWQVLGAAFLPDGRTILSREASVRGVQEPLEVRFHDGDTGRPLRSFPVAHAYPFWAPWALSRDGKTLAEVNGNTRQSALLWDTTTGKQVGEVGGSPGVFITALAFAPDGKTLASGNGDTAILLWDVRRARLEHLWSELADGPDEAVRGLKKLASSPHRAIPFLKDRLRAAAAAEARAGALIADLDADDFGVREKASRELERLGPDVAFALELALEGSPSAETRTRLRAVLGKVQAQNREGRGLDPRGVRLSLAVLEEIDTPEARQVLQELARGPAGTTVAREAGAALERLARRR